MRERGPFTMEKGSFRYGKGVLSVWERGPFKGPPVAFFSLIGKESGPWERGPGPLYDQCNSSTDHYSKCATVASQNTRIINKLECQISAIRDSIEQFTSISGIYLL